MREKESGMDASDINHGDSSQQFYNRYLLDVVIRL